MIRTNLLAETESRKIIDKMGHFSVIEYLRDISVSPKKAQEAYFASEMNVRKRQLVIDIDPDLGAYVQAGEMQIMMGDIEVTDGPPRHSPVFRGQTPPAYSSPCA